MIGWLGEGFIELIRIWVGMVNEMFEEMPLNGIKS